MSTEKETEELLPCHCGELPELASSRLLECGHKPLCPAVHRPAIAAALAKVRKEQKEKDAKIAQRHVKRGGCEPCAIAAAIRAQEDET